MATAAGEPMSAKSLATFAVGALALFWLVGLYAPASFPAHFTVFVLACFIGYMVDLERDAVAAHAADERDQRDLVDHRHRRARAAGAAARRGDATGPRLILGWRSLSRWC